MSVFAQSAKNSTCENSLRLKKTRLIFQIRLIQELYAGVKGGRWLAEFNAMIFILLCVLCILVFFYFCFQSVFIFLVSYLHPLSQLLLTRGYNQLEVLQARHLRGNTFSGKLKQKEKIVKTQFSSLLERYTNSRPDVYRVNVDFFIKAKRIRS